MVRIGTARRTNLRSAESASDTHFVQLEGDQATHGDLATLRGIAPEGAAGDGGNDATAYEIERLAALHSYRVLDTSPEPAFDDLTALAATLCQTPIALVSLVDKERLWFKSTWGLDQRCASRELSFCSEALGMNEALVVPDTQTDQRFMHSPLVAGPQGIRAYAGAPLTTPNGLTLGTLCVLDTVPRRFSTQQIAHLELLARQVMGQLELRRLAARLAGEVVARRETDGALVASQGALAESDQRWRALFEASPVAIALSDDNGAFTAVNEALCDLLGRDESDIIGHQLTDFIHPDDLKGSGRDGGPISAAPDGVVQVEKRLVRPSGQLRSGWLTLTHVPGPQSSQWTLVQMLDVTDRQADEKALREAEANLAALAEVVKDIQNGPDARQTIVEACCRLAGASHVTLLEPSDDGRDLRVTATTSPSFEGVTLALNSLSATVDCYLSGVANLLPEAISHPRISSDLLALSGATSLYIVPVLSGPTVVGVLTDDWIDRVADLDDRRVGAVTLLADHAGVALRQAALINELENIARTDQLTGLPNRRSWDHLLDLHMALSRRADQPLTVAIVDIDHFKAYNDSRGHTAGDELLRGFAVAGTNAIRKGDTLSRWGGEEFAIVLPDCDHVEAPSVLERVRRAMPDGQTCSIGFATWDKRESGDELVTRADQAMYRAKAAGRNQTIGD